MTSFLLKRNAADPGGTRKGVSLRNRDTPPQRERLTKGDD